MNRIIAGLVLLLGISGSANAIMLYGINTNVDTLVNVDSDTGVVTTVGSLGVNWGFGGLDFDSAGNLFGINHADNGLYSINQSTGAATLLGNAGIYALESLAILGDKGYSQDVLTNTLYEIDLVTGAATAIGGYTGGRVTGLTSDGSSLFGTRLHEDDLVRLDIATGLIDAIIGVHGLTATGLAYGENEFWIIEPFSSSNLYSLDSATAAPTIEQSGLGTGHITALTAMRAVVPEPATLALMGLGLAGIGFARKKKQS